MELGKCVLTQDKRSYVVQLFADRMYKTYFLHAHEIVISFRDLYQFLKTRNRKNTCFLTACVDIHQKIIRKFFEGIIWKLTNNVEK